MPDIVGQRKELQENHKVDHNDHILLETSVVESTNSLYDYSVVLGVQKAVAALLNLQKLPNFAI